MNKRKAFVQNDNNNAVAYYRYSSHAQNERSIDQQRKEVEQYAELHGYTIVREYWDEALSGTDNSRPYYRRMLQDIIKMKPAVLIIYKIDRLARDQYELLCTRRHLRDHGIAIERVAEPNVDPNDPMSVIVNSMFDSMSEFYSLNLRQQVMRGMEDAAELGRYLGHKLLGYKVKKKEYVLDDDTAPVVLRIFNEYAGGKTLKQICDDLNTQGLKTVHGNKFVINSLRNIIMNRAYIGEYHYGDIVIPDRLPRIVSDELFEQAQARLESNKHKPKQSIDSSEALEPRFWLSGKLYCGECGERLQGTSGTSKSGKIHYYYACKMYRRHKCKLKPVKKDFIEYCVVEVLKDFLSDDEKLVSLAVEVAEYSKKKYADDSYLQTLKTELKKTEKELDNIISAIKQGIFSQTVQDALNELETRKEALERAIDEEQVKLSLSHDDNSIKRYFEMYRDADFTNDETRDCILEYFIDKIFVYEDKLVIDLFTSDDRTEIDMDMY